MNYELADSQANKCQIPFIGSELFSENDKRRYRYQTWGYSENHKDGIVFHDYEKNKSYKIGINTYLVDRDNKNSAVIHVTSEDHVLDCFYGSPESNYKANLVSQIIKDIKDYIFQIIKDNENPKRIKYEQLTLF